MCCLWQTDRKLVRHVDVYNGSVHTHTLAWMPDAADVGSKPEPGAVLTISVVPFMQVCQPTESLLSWTLYVSTQSQLQESINTGVNRLLLIPGGVFITIPNLQMEFRPWRMTPVNRVGWTASTSSHCCRSLNWAHQAPSYRSPSWMPDWRQTQRQSQTLSQNPGQRPPSACSFTEMWRPETETWSLDRQSGVMAFLWWWST